MVATTLAALTPNNTHNISVLNEKILEIDLENLKLNHELISLREETKKRRKVGDHLTPLKENILKQQ